MADHPDPFIPPFPIPSPSLSGKEEAEPIPTRTGGPSNPPKTPTPKVRKIREPKPNPVGRPKSIAKLHADGSIETYGRTARDRIAQWVALRSAEPGIQNVEVARRLGISVRHLNTLISDARREGWLVLSDPLERLEHEIIPKTLDNLNHFLDAKDRAVTIATANGTIFKQFQESKIAKEQANTILAIKIEAPAPGETRLITGQILGKPREIKQGEFIEVEAE